MICVDIIKQIEKDVKKSIDDYKMNSEDHCDFWRKDG